MLRLLKPVFGLSAHDATCIWIAVLDLAGAISAYEIAAEVNVFGWGWHTISWWSFTDQWLGWGIFAAILSVAAWWLWHFKHPHPR